ncbi:hypothetical protein GCM10023170_000200 [Phytohabitans houttuyneae]|uniref:Uncharacterized protein n=1 Tax=Phytohabitans houttuyneae TaxID=1076126 RepID=A0A6V8K4A1_9ACTN|nr:hypothetical protein Phou_025500 [Phytohabitans houttuyneae]
MLDVHVETEDEERGDEAEPGQRREPATGGIWAGRGQGGRSDRGHRVTILGSDPGWGVAMMTPWIPYAARIVRMPE